MITMMSQKAKALETYNALKNDYNSWTNWNVPATKRFDLVVGEVTEEACENAYDQLTDTLAQIDYGFG